MEQSSTAISSSLLNGQSLVGIEKLTATHSPDGAGVMRSTPNRKEGQGGGAEKDPHGPAQMG